MQSYFEEDVVGYDSPPDHPSYHTKQLQPQQTQQYASLQAQPQAEILTGALIMNHCHYFNSGFICNRGCTQKSLLTTPIRSRTSCSCREKSFGS